MNEIGSKATLDDLTRGLMCYKKLGLAFEKPDEDRLCLHFTQIDPDEPEKRFTIEVGLGHEWIVTSCTLLPIEMHEALVAPLNEKNDVNRFARTVRKAFVEQLQQ
jgi:Chromosome segregation protein Spc25